MALLRSRLLISVLTKAVSLQLSARARGRYGMKPDRGDLELQESKEIEVDAPDLVK
jgi:hypothetical protein